MEIKQMATKYDN